MDAAKWKLLVGDVTTCELEGPFDAVFCDPPYELGFMAKEWDKAGVSFNPSTWKRFCDACRPGAPLLTFGGTRTFHRIACAVEDGGWEIRDCVMWLYGQGFPKSQNIGLAIDKAAGAERDVVGSRVLTGNAAISTKEKGGTYGIQVGSIPPKEVPVTAPKSELAKQWDGYGTALKPAWEPITVARKPLEGIMAENVSKYGVGGLAIDDCRIGNSQGCKKVTFPNGETNNVYGDGLNGNAEIDRDIGKGRWPANLMLSHTEDCKQVGTKTVNAPVINRFDDGMKPFGDGACHPYTSTGGGKYEVPVYECSEDCPVRQLDENSGNRPSHQAVLRHGGGGKIFGKAKGGYAKVDGGYTDNGGPSRFFFCAKVSTKERNAGLEDMPILSAGEATDRVDGSAGLSSPRAGAGRTGGSRNPHPTLKPIQLTTYLARLILPPYTGRPRRILVPFAGTGSEMIGALLAGWDEVVGIEMDETYVRIGEKRIQHWVNNR